MPAASKRTKISLALTAIFVLIANLPILRSSWSGDDWPNAQTPYWIEWRYGSLSPDRIMGEALYWNQQWMAGAGRFYPLAFIESRFMFSIFQSVLSYKILQFLVIQCVVFLAAKLVWRTNQQWRHSIFIVICLQILFQFRSDFDPHVGFSLLLPSLFLKLLLAENWIYRSYFAQGLSKWLLLSLGCIFLFAAMSTYEYALLISPFVLLPIFLSESVGKRYDVVALLQRLHRIRIQFLVYVFTVISYLLFVFLYLRPRATSVSGAYVLGFSWKSIPTFFINLPAGLPLFNFRQSDMKFLGQYSVQIGIAALLLLYLSRSSRPEIRQKKISKGKELRNGPSSEGIKVWIALGTLFTVAPALMLAIQEVWWAQSKWGHSYLGVFIQEIGLGFLLLAIFTARTGSMTRQDSQLMSKSWLPVLLPLLVLGLAHNYAVSDLTRNRDFVYDSWNTLLTGDLAFEGLKNGDAVISSTANDAFEANAGVVYDKTGLRLSYLYNAGIVWPNLKACAPQNCDLEPPYQRAIQILPNITRDSRDSKEWANSAAILLSRGDAQFVYSDFYPVSTKTALFFEVPFIEPQLNSLVDMSRLKVVTLSKEATVFRPRFGETCLTEARPMVSINGFTLRTYLPSSGILDVRELSVSSCP